ncbi:MAG: DUF4190 domain-containing protein [Clostridiales bacterium]|jgi:hypothetical protein|nr:DUF4190 domain-containing protein [Clostridiales bacterium]
MNNNVNYNSGRSQNNGKAVASLVLGILSIVFCQACGLGTIMAIIGLILGRNYLIEVDGNDGIAKAGKITSIVGLVLGILAIIFWIVYFLFFIYLGTEGYFQEGFYQ